MGPGGGMIVVREHPDPDSIRWSMGIMVYHLPNMSQGERLQVKSPAVPCRRVGPLEYFESGLGLQSSPS
jgi:hypothetical protein